METYALTGKELRKSAFLLTLFESILVVVFAVSILGCDLFDNSRSRIIEPPETSEAPIAAFSVSVESGSVPLTVDFVDESIDGTATITSWQWDFGDGTTSTAQNPQHVFNAQGTYSISLTVTSPDGSDIETKTDLITAEVAEPSEVTLKISAVDTDGVLLDEVTVESLDFDVVEQHETETGIALAVLPAEQDGVFKISKPGYLTNYLFTEGVLTNRSQRVTLKKKAEPIIFEGLRGGSFYGEDGTGVEIAGEAFRRADGSIATGEIELYMTPIDISDAIEETAFPGSYYGATALGEPQEELFSYGVFDITFEQEGEELQLADDEVATLTLPLYATKSFTDEDLMVGDTIPLWFLDVATGLWIYESEGTVVEDDTSPNGLALQATTSHFTTFNSDINPPGLSRNGSGGGGGANPGDHVCSMTIELLGAEEGSMYNYSVIYSRAGWPASRRSRKFTYDGSSIGQNILRGFLVTITVSKDDVEGSTSFFCNGSDINETITLGDQPPEIKDFNLRVEPIFDRAVDNRYEIIANKIYVGGYWVGAEEGIIDSELLSAPLILSRGIYKEVPYHWGEPSPVVFTANVSNEFGADSAETAVEFIEEHPPVLGISYAYYEADFSHTLLGWHNLEGADTLEVFHLDSLTQTDGEKLGETIALEFDQGIEYFPGELQGYFRLVFANQYGTSSEVIQIGGAACPPFSDLCGPTQ